MGFNAVAGELAKAEIVFDKFHVLQHASAALDEVAVFHSVLFRLAVFILPVFFCVLLCFSVALVSVAVVSVAVVLCGVIRGPHPTNAGRIQRWSARVAARL